MHTKLLDARPGADAARREADRVDAARDRALQGPRDRQRHRPPHPLEPGVPDKAPKLTRRSPGRQKPCVYEHETTGSIASTMRAADALMESLKAEGVEHVFGIPGGANLPTYDALYDAEFHHIQVRHEQGGGHAAEGYAKASGKVGVAFATSGPGRDQPGHGDRRRDAGLGPDRLHHRPGADRADRHRRLPGGRHHSASTLPIVKHSFQVHGPAPDSRVHPRGLPRRLDRASGAGPASTSRRTSREPKSTTSRARSRSSWPATSRRARATSSRSASPRRRSPTPAAGPLRGRRRGQRQRLRGAARAGGRRPLPGHLHADGPRRLPGLRTSSGSGCSACTAPAPPTTRWTRPT